MAIARETVRLGLAARGQAKIAVRRPLRAAVVVATGSEREAIERLSEIVREELNVKELRFVSEADELGEIELKPNYRTLGPRFGKHMPIVAAAVAGLDAAHAAATVRDGGHVAISVDGKDHELTADDLQVSMKPLEGYQVEREGSHAVALELEIDQELLVEGWAREIVRAIQRARQDAGLEVTDRILLTLDGDASLLDAARTHETYIAGETLAVPSATSRWTGRWRRSTSMGASCASEWRWRPRRSAGSSSATSLRFGYAPITVFAGWPLRNRISVGIDITLNWIAVFWFSSMLSLTTFSSSARSCAISSTTGATMRHGPHHGAQKSTSTGTSDSMTSAWKLLSVTSETVPAMRAPWGVCARVLQKV